MVGLVKDVVLEQWLRGIMRFLFFGTWHKYYIFVKVSIFRLTCQYLFRQNLFAKLVPTESFRRPHCELELLKHSQYNVFSLIIRNALSRRILCIYRLQTNPVAPEAVTVRFSLPSLKVHFKVMTLTFGIGVTASSVRSTQTLQHNIYSVKPEKRVTSSACIITQKQCRGILKQRTIPIIMRKRMKRLRNTSMIDVTGSKLEVGNFSDWISIPSWHSFRQRLSGVWLSGAWWSLKR